MNNLSFPEYRRINGDCVSNYRALAEEFSLTTKSFPGLQFRCLGPIPKYIIASGQNKNPFEEGWYERSVQELVKPDSDEGVFIYTYFETVDITIDPEKVYYKQQIYSSDQLFCLGLKASVIEEGETFPEQCVLCYVPIGSGISREDWVQVTATGRFNQDATRRICIESCNYNEGPAALLQWIEDNSIHLRGFYPYDLITGIKYDYTDVDDEQEQGIRSFGIQYFSDLFQNVDENGYPIDVDPESASEDIQNITLKDFYLNYRSLIDDGNYVKISKEEPSENNDKAKIFLHKLKPTSN